RCDRRLEIDADHASPILTENLRLDVSRQLRVAVPLYHVVGQLKVPEQLEYRLRMNEHGASSPHQTIQGVGIAGRTEQELAQNVGETARRNSEESCRSLEVQVDVWQRG